MTATWCIHTYLTAKLSFPIISCVRMPQCRVYCCWHSNRLHTSLSRLCVFKCIAVTDKDVHTIHNKLYCFISRHSLQTVYQSLIQTVHFTVFTQWNTSLIIFSFNQFWKKKTIFTTCCHTLRIKRCFLLLTRYQCRECIKGASLQTRYQCRECIKGTTLITRYQCRECIKGTTLITRYQCRECIKGQHC